MSARTTSTTRDITLGLGGLLLVAAALVPYHQVFSTSAWRGEVALAAALATLVTVATRRVGLPAWVAAMVGAGLLVQVTVLLHAGDALWPSTDALRTLGDVIRQGLEEVREQPSPTPPLEGLMLLLAGGTWLVAHLVHESLVRVERLGPAFVAAGTLWLMPLAVPNAPEPTWPNMLPIFVAVGLLLVLVQPRESGRWTREASARPGVVTGLVLTVVAAITAILLPSDLPGYGAPAWFDVGGSGAPRGYQPIVDVGDRLHLPEPRDVLRVTATGSTYLRLAALDTFDGRTWRLGPANVDTYRPSAGSLFRADGELPFETPIRSGTTFGAHVDVLDLENIYVPVPYQISEIDGPDDASLFYSTEGGFVATGDVADNELQGELRVGVRPGFSYDIESVIPSPAYADLAEMGSIRLDPGHPLTALPHGYPELAAQAQAVLVATGAETTIDRALAIQDWFISPESTFTYSTDVPELRGDDALLDFVLESQVGYCEYFATAMAVMLRTQGIAARVSVGFLPGRLSVPPDTRGGPGTFTISTNDAHAWVEVLFPGYGWIQMDPTPRSGTLPAQAGDLLPRVGAEDFGQSGPIEVPSVEPAPSAEASEEPTDTATDTQEADADGVAGGAGGGVRRGVLGLLTLVLLLVAGTVAAVQALPWLRRWRDRRLVEPVAVVLAAQRRVLATADLLGFGREPDETIGELTDRWVREGIVPAAPAAALSRLAAQAAFAGRASDADAAEVLEVERRLLAALGDACSGTERIMQPLRRVARGVVTTGARRLAGRADRVRDRRTRVP